MQSSMYYQGQYRIIYPELNKKVFTVFAGEKRKSVGSGALHVM